MNLKSICAGVLLLTVAAACSGTPSTPAAPPTAEPTAVPVSAQQLPAATAVPTREPTPIPRGEVQPTATGASPTPSLAADAPRLIFPSADGLMIVNADGTSKTLIDDDLPTMSRNLGDGISPHARSLAYRAGDNPLTPEREGSQPMTLNLLQIDTGVVQPITPLFSHEMEQAVQAAMTGDRLAATDAGMAVAELDDTLAWSPDGRYLAFIAAIDGPSSDVYSYDREAGQINRLTDGPNQAARLFWSPDSQWIVHEEVESFGTGAGYNVKAVWAAAPDGSGNRKLYDTTFSGDEVFVTWVSPRTFLAYSWTPIGLQNIRWVDLDTGEAQRIGPTFPVQAMAYDPESQALLTVVDDYTAQQNTLSGGLYLTTPAESQPKLIASGDWYVTRWLPHAKLFFAQGRDGVSSVASNGTAQEYIGEGAVPIDSPDGAWLMAWGDGNFTSPIGLRLYTPDGELARQLTADPVYLATWSPDSDGVFYTSEGRLYYVAIPNGQPQLIEENTLANETGSLGWVMPK